MARRISIQAGPVTVYAELDESVTANAIWKTLPVTATANTWGEEVYFAVPVALGAEDGREVVSAGDIAYWPPGKAFCIFFGPTPASRTDEIRAASPVNVFGKLVVDPAVLAGVSDGDKVTVRKAE